MAWGIGTIVKITVGTDTEKEVGKVLEVNIPGVTTDMKDATFLSITDNPDGFEMVAPTLHKGEEGSVRVARDSADAGQKALIDAQIARSKVAFVVIFPDGSNNATFDAYVSGVEIGSITPDGLIETTIKFKPTGPVTI